MKYFIGLRKDNGEWEWSSNKATVDSFHGESPRVPGQPSGTSILGRTTDCATIYCKHRRYLMSRRRRMKDTEHICQRAMSQCTKHERGWSFCAKESVLKDQGHAFSVYPLR